MVNDPMRTRPLMRAVARAVQRGDIVLDIGTGLGGLAIGAAKNGAKHVWAIDCDREALDIATFRAKKAGCLHKISFIEGLSLDLELPKRADLVICETVGSFAFDENILATLSDAKRRLLRRGGRIIPTMLELWGAPCRCLPKAQIARLCGDDLLGPPSRFGAIDFRKKIPTIVHVKQRLRCSKAGTIRAIAVWPFITWWWGEVTDASPLALPTHWKQGILPVEPRKVSKGEEIVLEFITRPHPDDKRCMTERMWRWV